MSEIENGKI
jgi:chromosome segregation ATPase